MKYIFDFDDVLFDNTKRFKEHMYMSLEKAGVPRSVAEEYYKTVRGKEFSLKNFLKHFSLKEQVYEEIMQYSENCLNKELLETIKKLGRENCFVITYGDREFQLDKIKRTGIAEYFSEIIVTLDSKKEAVEKICGQYKDEKIFFIDDKVRFFEDLDFKKCPNLKTILYNGQDIKNLLDF